MTRHLDRLRASQELRDLNIAFVAACASEGDKEIIQELRAALTEQMGVVMRFKEKASRRSEIEAFMVEAGS